MVVAGGGSRVVVGGDVVGTVVGGNVVVGATVVFGGAVVREASVARADG